jgi:DNA-binding NarL/FixJ family response regulator
MGHADTFEPSQVENEKLEAIVFIHDLLFIRECVGRQLKDFLPGRIVETIARPENVIEVANRFTISVIVVWLSESESTAKAAQVLGSLAPGRPVVIISDLTDADEVRSAFRAGARGYLLSSMGAAEVATAIQFVSAGGTYVPASVLSGLTTLPSATSETVQAGRDFSPRQMDVLKRLQEGKPNKIIAHELGMAESTVKVHIRVIMRKLNARNRTQVVLMTGRKLQQERPVAIPNRAAVHKTVPLTTFLERDRTLPVTASISGVVRAAGFRGGSLASRLSGIAVDQEKRAGLGTVEVEDV